MTHPEPLAVAALVVAVVALCESSALVLGLVGYLVWRHFRNAHTED